MADDTDTIRALFEKLLTNDGYQVISAVDGIEALDAVSVYHPDVIVTDIGMPGVDGIEVCRRLKRDPSTHLTPVVLVTGLSDLPDRIRGIEAGADDFLTKPVHPQELRARVAALLRMKQLTDALDSAEAAFMALAMTIEARDPTTRGHCERLAHHAVRLGRVLGLSNDDLSALHRGGYLHDVGKVGVPDSVLLKAGPLSETEFALMKRHTEIGEMCARRYSRFDTCDPSFARTTNGSTAAAIPTAYAATRFRCSLRLWELSTSMMRLLRSARIGHR